MLRVQTLKRAAGFLETGSLLLAAAGLLFRATFYWQFPAADGQAGGTGDLLELVLMALLFVVCCLCAASGVAISFLGERSDKRHAYQAFFIGVTSFIAYDWLHPHMPRLL